MTERTPASLLSPSVQKQGKQDGLMWQGTTGPEEVFASFLPQAVAVDFQKQKVHFMDGSSHKYNQLLIATGCQ